jgi:threonine aldolase
VLNLVVDLRSDILAPRSRSVIEAVADAFTALPSFLPAEDPQERRLLAMVKEMLGAEAALFVPTCTLANQLAIRCWLPTGGIVGADAACHLVTVEARALELTGAKPQALHSENGHVTPEAVGQFLDGQSDKSKLVWLENTHNFGGGSIMPATWQADIHQHCASASTPLHLDGSRLWNAAVASGSSMAAMAHGATSVAVSLNKSLGAPLGAILAGPGDMIETATQLRAAMSGEWRPIGPMAAGALVAIEQWRQRLTMDHANAFELAARLKLSLGANAVSTPATNLIVLNCPNEQAGVIAKLAADRGVRVLPIGGALIRLAIHSGLTPDNLSKVAEALSSAWDEGLSDRVSTLSENGVN